MSSLHPRPIGSIRFRPWLLGIACATASWAGVAAQSSWEQAAGRDASSGQRVGAYYVLTEGETVSEVARRHDVELDRIARANGWSDDDLMARRSGDRVFVPGIDEAELIGPDAEAVYHQMGPQESLWDLASRYQVGVSEILAANDMSKQDARRLHPDRRVRIPGVTRMPSGRHRRNMRASQRRAQQLAGELGLGSARVARRLWRGWPREAWVQAAGPAALLDETLLWPVKTGHFVRGYGSGKGDYHLAIDVGAAVGQKVRAAAGGLVAYSGKAISGYGRVVFVVHPGGAVTMYAHNSANEVVAGERVARGDVVAEVGSSGITRGPHLHLELLYRGKLCDPTYLFRPGVRMRGGRYPDWSGTASWQPGTQRPPAVDCNPRREYPDG
jgi:murein DD-endopeptidase MepM/ murein hydrolase activator NlpD